MTDLKFKVYREVENTRTHRAIRVIRDEAGVYRLAEGDVINSNAQSNGLQSGKLNNPIPSAKLNIRELYEYQTLEEANTGARLLFQKYLAEGWLDGTPAGNDPLEYGDTVSVKGQSGIWKIVGTRTEEPRWQIQRGADGASQRFVGTDELTLVSKAERPPTGSAFVLDRSIM